MQRLKKRQPDSIPRDSVVKEERPTPQCPVKPRPPGRPLPFDQRYTRTTTYLENDLHDRIHGLNDARAIASITAALNDALREYLNRNYPNP